MKNALKCTGKQNCSAAHVVDGKLILSFPGAITPIIWQMDLAQTKASALEVRDNKTDGSAILFLKTPKGESMEVAAFSKKDDAMKGLMAASCALSQAQGQIRGNAVNNNELYETPITTARQRRFSWKTFILGCFLILALLVLWSSLTGPLPANTAQNTGAVIPDTSVQNQDSGVPLSADEYLRNR